MESREICTKPSDCSKNLSQPKTKYKLEKEPIGKGSFSIVYHATDSQMNEYAIKKINLGKLDSGRLGKFMQELDISVQMDHENIVKCNEVFKTERYWYIVTEYCNYGTFTDLILALSVTEPTQRENLCHYYLNQLKNALHYLNANGIIHRDLKPQNILLTKDKNKNNEVIVKLADFGFSRYFNQQINTKSDCDDMDATICGTPMYMAPELLINGKYNKKADLWSFGVVMYELLYGKNPFNFPKNITHLTTLIKQQQITYTNDFSSKCNDLIKTLLNISPENRITWEAFFNHEWFKHVPFPDETSFALPEEINLVKPRDEIKHIIDNVIKIKEQSKILSPPQQEITYQPPSLSIEQIKPKLTKIGSVNDFNYVQQYCGDVDSCAVATKVAIPPIGKPVKSSENLDDFIIVEKAEDGTETASPKRPIIQNYREVTHSTIIQIMMDSVNYLYGQAKGY